MSRPALAVLALLLLPVPGSSSAQGQVTYSQARLHSAQYVYRAPRYHPGRVHVPRGYAYPPPYAVPYPPAYRYPYRYAYPPPYRYAPYPPRSVCLGWAWGGYHYRGGRMDLCF